MIGEAWEDPVILAEIERVYEYERLIAWEPHVNWARLNQVYMDDFICFGYDSGLVSW